MKRSLLCVLALMLSAAATRAAEDHAARGLILKIDKARNSLLVSCEAIPNYMAAMTMPLAVRDAVELNSLTPGTMIDFTLTVDGDASYIHNIRVHHYESVEQDPLGARRLKLLASVASDKPTAELHAGDHVPDFTLIDQTNTRTSLYDFRGKVVAITFTYTKCALPNFCFRIANNFRQLQGRFASHLGNDLVFLTITFDPVHDTPEVMAKYGKTWNADPKGWRLLTGSQADVESICNRFGISYWPDEGLMTHSLHTVVIDRHGNLTSDLEGNEYSAAQLGDLLQTMLSQPERRSGAASDIGR